MIWYPFLFAETVSYNLHVPISFGFPLFSRALFRSQEVMQLLYETLYSLSVKCVSSTPVAYSKWINSKPWIKFSRLFSMAGGATPQDSLVKGSESGSLPVQTANNYDIPSPTTYIIMWNQIKRKWNLWFASSGHVTFQPGDKLASHHNIYILLEMEKLQCENEAILIGRCFAMQFEGESNLTTSQKTPESKIYCIYGCLQWG